MAHKGFEAMEIKLCKCLVNESCLSGKQSQSSADN